MSIPVLDNRPRRWAGAVFTLLLVLGGLTACSPPDDGGNGPTVTDDRLTLTRFASDPDIMTPIGIAVDNRDRIFVLESHTHLEPDDFEGPEGDRIKIFRDPDNDGRPDSISVFAEGLDDGMNIAFSPDGTLYLVSSMEVWALYDRDDDGVSEDREKVLDMVQPDYVYDHAGLMGITFSHDGWMYITRGNVEGANWKMVGTDGSSVAGYGDGGNIMRGRRQPRSRQATPFGVGNGIMRWLDGDQ